MMNNYERQLAITNKYKETSKQKSCTSPASGKTPSSFEIEAGMGKFSFLSVTRSRKNRSNFSRESLSVTAAKDQGIANSIVACGQTDRQENIAICVVNISYYSTALWTISITTATFPSNWYLPGPLVISFLSLSVCLSLYLSFSTLIFRSRDNPNFRLLLVNEIR